MIWASAEKLPPPSLPNICPGPPNRAVLIRRKVIGG